MTDAPSSRASFWREALASLRPALEREWRWVAGFSLLFAAAHFFVANLVPADLVEQLRSHPELIRQDPGLMRQYMFKADIGALSQIFIFAPVYYVLLNLYLKNEQGTPQMTAGHFFFWLGMVCRKYLLLFVPLFLSLLVIGLLVAGTLVVFKMPHAVGVAVAILGTAAGLFYFWRTSLRLFLVSPLAALRRTPVLDGSRTLTKNQCWRILLGFLAVTAFMMLLFAVPFIVLMGTKMVFGADSLTGRLLMALLSGAWMAIFLMTDVAYRCTVYRILSHEQKSAAAAPVQN